jgi:outer membrane protein TolC
LKTLLLLIISLNTLASLQTIEDLKQINLDYLEAKFNKENTEAEKTEALFQYLPTINLFASHFESAASFNSLNNDINSQGIQARWNIFTFFKDTYTYIAKKNEYKATKEFKNLSELTAEKSSFEVFLNYLNSYEQYLVKKEITETLNQSAKVAKAKFNRGEASGSATSKIEIQALSTENDSEQFLADSLFYEERIEKLLNITDLSKAWPITEEEFKVKVPMVLAKTIDTKNNPNLKMLKYREEALEDMATAQKLRHAGNVSLSYQNQKSNLDNFKDWDTQISINYTFPLFANNSIQKDVITAKNQWRLAKTRLEQEKAKIKGLKSSLKSKLMIQFENFKRRKKASDLSNRVYKQELKKFQRGVISVNDLLFEQQRQSQSQIGLITAKRNLILTLVDYCHMQGMGFKTCIQ